MRQSALAFFLIIAVFLGTLQPLSFTIEHSGGKLAVITSLNVCGEAFASAQSDAPFVAESPYTIPHYSHCMTFESYEVSSLIPAVLSLEERPPKA